MDLHIHCEAQRVRKIMFYFCRPDGSEKNKQKNNNIKLRVFVMASFSLNSFVWYLIVGGVPVVVKVGIVSLALKLRVFVIATFSLNSIVRYLIVGGVPVAVEASDDKEEEEVQEHETSQKEEVVLHVGVVDLVVKPRICNAR